MNSFIVINQEFTCLKCGYHNPKLPGSCRNHCLNCLYSMHVDKTFPGDRDSQCHGLMAPYALRKNTKKGWMIHHKCLKCHKEISNKAAFDDNIEVLTYLIQKPFKAKKKLQNEPTGNQQA